MRVLLLSSWYPPVRSGSSFWAESLVKALRRRGHEVRVVTTRWKGAEREPSGAREEVVYHLPAWLVPRNRFLLGLPIVPVAWSRLNRRRVLEIVHAFKPHVIHQISHIFDTLFLSAYAARKTGTPLVGSITTPIQSSSGLVQSLMRAVDRVLVYRFGVRHWDRIICSDSEQARYARDAYGQRIEGRLVTHIFAGIHERVRHAQAEPKTPWPQIVTVGHIHKIRDPLNLIRAMPVVLESFPDAKFDIAGRVQMQEPVREVQRLGLERAVHFLGEVPVEQVAKLVSRAHVFAILHQCRYAGLSFTAIEAMEFGTPVIINAPADLYGPGMVRDGENIVLVDGKRPDTIARRIIELLADADRRERIGQNGKQFVASHLNWDVNAERTEQLYSELQ